MMNIYLQLMKRLITNLINLVFGIKVRKKHDIMHEVPPSVKPHNEWVLQLCGNAL